MTLRVQDIDERQVKNPESKIQFVDRIYIAACDV